MRIELINLGDELLLGIRDNSHLKYIGKELERYGLTLQQDVVLPDNFSEIVGAFKAAYDRSDIIITTGGLSAAAVNNLREAVSQVLGVSLEFVEETKNSIQGYFESIGRTMGKRYLRQCYKLEGSDLIPNNFGTAPGIWFQRGKKLLIMLPAMESELRPMFENQVIPRLQDLGMLRASKAYLQLRTIGIDEDQLEELLGPIFGNYGGIKVNYCLHQGIIDIRISTDVIDYPWSEIKKIGEECKGVLRENFFCYGHQTLAECVFESLRGMDKTLSIAESCTGGKASDAFTNIAGSSKVFAGGLICYNNEAKIHLLGVPEALIQQHGSVSAEVAVAMAAAVAENFSTNYGLSITGYAGPGGGTPANPIGTVYIGYHSPAGDWAHKISYPGQREAIKIHAVNAALDCMRRQLLKDKIESCITELNGD